MKQSTRGQIKVRRRERDPRTFLENREVASQHSAGVDLAWTVVVGVAVVVAAIWLALPDRVLDAFDRSGQIDFNGILALILVTPIGATYFATRRYRDAVGAQRELAHLSDHDALTRLPNRRNLDAVLRRAFLEARIINAHAGVMFVDLDGFKAVNDTYGHEVGDQLMIAVAERLREVCGTDRWVARYGGDEFVVLDLMPTAPDATERFACGLVESISQPFQLGEDRISISASVGIAFGTNSDEPDSIVRDADLAMYEAKKSDTRVKAFTGSMRSSLTPGAMGARLERALTDGEFRLMYQPMVVLRSGQVVGVEALLRWEDPARGLIEPAAFMPALEATGLIVPVGRWVMNEVCSRARQWSEQMPPGVPALRVSMNVSSRELSQTDFVDGIAAALAASGTDPESVYLEADEIALTSDSLNAWTALKGARELGVGLALDNFGSGFTSLSHLRNFEFNLLKLEGSFAARISDQDSDGAIVRSVVALAGDLGIAVLAEGLSDEASVQHLDAAGCQLGQGRIIADPLSAATVDELIAGGLAGISVPSHIPSAPEEKTTRASASTRTATVVLPQLRVTEVK